SEPVSSWLMVARDRPARRASLCCERPRASRRSRTRWPISYRFMSRDTSLNRRMCQVYSTTRTEPRPALGILERAYADALEALTKINSVPRSARSTDAGPFRWSRRFSVAGAAIQWPAQCEPDLPAGVPWQHLPEYPRQ